jgi:hypothetical protein
MKEIIERLENQDILTLAKRLKSRRDYLELLRGRMDHLRHRVHWAFRVQFVVPSPMSLTEATSRFRQDSSRLSRKVRGPVALARHFRRDGQGRVHSAVAMVSHPLFDQGRRVKAKDVRAIWSEAEIERFRPEAGLRTYLGDEAGGLTLNIATERLADMPRGRGKTSLRVLSTLTA